MASEEAKGEAHEVADTTPTDSEKPAQSRYVVLTGYGGLNKVEVQHKDKPKPGEGQVLVKVHACGLNFADIMQRQGVYPGAPPTPYVLGYECSGLVEELGANVSSVEVGVRVMALSPTFGAMAEYITIPAEYVFPIPDSMSFEDAAAIPLNYMTAYHILFDIGGLKEGQSVLVHMAGGGVGIAACQLCRTVPNVTVFGTSSKGKHEKITSHGVTHPIDYQTLDYAKEVRKIQSEGVDIVMDPLGGKDTNKGYELLKPFGKIICYGIANSVKGQTKSFFTRAKTWVQSASYSPLKLLGDSRGVAGYHGGIISKNHPELVASALQAVIKLYEEEKVKPEIHAVLSLEEIRDAMQCMQDRKNIGKMVLSPFKEPPKAEPKVEQKAEENKTEEKKEEDKPCEEEGKKETEEEGKKETEEGTEKATESETGEKAEESKPEETAS